jgi:putative SOS response-associated peptidase YedK
MCGRFAVAVTASMIASHFNLSESIEFSPNYNITPSQQIPVIASMDGKRTLSFMRWGLIPYWAKDEKIGYRMINARSETAFEKPAFCSAVMSRRCLIPASGFFEWKKVGKRVQPFYVTVRHQELFSFAGLWETWQKSADEIITSCSILTTKANDLVVRIHDRMPVIISPEEYDKWILAGAGVDELKQLLQPFPAGEMQAYPVSQAVNNPRHTGVDCIAPLKDT